MSSWKTKHLKELKDEHNLMIDQIELDKKCYARNIQKLKDLKEVIEKLEELDK